MEIRRSAVERGLRPPLPLWGFRSAVEMAASAAPKGSGEQAELGERGKVGFLFFRPCTYF
ncbi:hypothetical protein OXV64_18535 [Bacteroides fragilis]|uniref:hypothetical protein n=1 Tax=Bacteroides hominis TaxID=2763023 RepID=UPI00229FE74F|nr:hypothetical protein [Bacteroides fragilis]MCY6332761.1 hypothetical protein [Bacteroides fragilis]